MRVVFITCCFLLLSGTTKGSELASDVLQCLKIQQTVSRLQCYDSIAQKLQVQPVVVTEQATTTAIPAEQMPVQAHVSPQAATAPQPESQFGLKQKDPSELLGSISGKVLSVLPVTAEGQIQPSGNLMTDNNQAGRIPVQIQITDPAFDAYRHLVPGGAFGQAAIYSEHAHHVAIMRKILLRMSAWMNYLFPFH